jgi:hypothetical protein
MGGLAAPSLVTVRQVAHMIAIVAQRHSQQIQFILVQWHADIVDLLTHLMRSLSFSV